MTKTRSKFTLVNVNFVRIVLCFAFTVFVASTIHCGNAMAQEKNADSTVKSADEISDTFLNAKTVVFLGDSITYHGGFLVTLESIVAANGHAPPEIINLGLSSETCSGDSEPIHPFPRPNVHERFQRVIKKVSPDLLVVNYGMNDGIYHPFSKERFEKYKDGINKIIDAAEQSDGKTKVILVTPPPFDPVPLRKKGKLVSKDADDFSWKEVYENYDSEVLEVYSNWILEQKSRVAGCIDLRTPMAEDIASNRKSNPDFHYAHDGVHVDAKGHELIGSLLAKAMNLDSSQRLSDQATELISKRQQLLRDSWLSEVGHKRPGIKEGKPIAEAKLIAQEIDLKLKELAEQTKKEK